MGGAVARGLAQRAEAAGYSLTVSNPSEGKLSALKADCPFLNVTADNRRAAHQADLIILAVKPWKIRDVITEIRTEVNTRRQSVASLAAGISLAQLHAWFLPEDGSDESMPRLYRVIPNTAATVLESMTFISPAQLEPGPDACVREVFGALGEAVLVEESKLAACTALSSCGLAFVMRYIRAAMSGGVELGLSVCESRDYMLQTMLGAVRMLRASGCHPEEEIDRVTTPGGLTIRGLNAMEAHGFTNSVIQGLKASVH